MRREARLGRHFSSIDFERAYRSFQQMYHVRPLTVLCSPDVLERFSVLYSRSGDGLRRELRYEGVRVLAAVMPPGTVAFEGEVDPDRMGDW